MIVDQARRIRRFFERVTPGPLLVRCAIAITAGGALVTAYPDEIIKGRGGLGLALVAVIPALAPRGRWVTLVALAAVFGWLLSTMGYEEPVSLWRVFGIAGLLYLMHSMAALAAMLPYDAVVAPEVLGRWVGRALLVVASSAALSLLVVIIADAASGGSVLASLAGLVVAVAVTALLTHLLRRQTPPSSGTLRRTGPETPG